MKQKIILFVCILTIMAMVPVFGLHTALQKTVSQDKKQTDNINADDICKMIAYVCDTSYCDESVKAVSQLIKTNIAAGHRYEQKETDNDLFNRVKKLYHSSTPVITLKGKREYIPFAVCSNGMTEYDKKLPYLSSVASPWDYFSKHYDKQAACVGVSLDGLDYLCKNGLSAQQALKWYLPEMDS